MSEDKPTKEKPILFWVSHKYAGEPERGWAVWAWFGPGHNRCEVECEDRQYANACAICLATEHRVPLIFGCKADVEAVVEKLTSRGYADE